MTSQNQNSPTDKDINEILENLRLEMGLQTKEEVVTALARQAYHRATILCPRCGHHARQTDNDKAECTKCLAPLKLADAFLVALDRK